jgi:DNA invertase Pin-like site-specific DNA recombinase
VHVVQRPKGAHLFAQASVLNINSAYAEFELDIIRDRVKAGVKAKREKTNGVWGRRSVADETQTQIQELISQGISIRNVAKTLHIAKGTVQKYMKQVAQA